MSYIPDFLPDAEAGFESLEIWLQEETLDEMEKLLAKPETLNFDITDTLKVFDFKRDRAGVRHVVFLTIRLDSRFMVMKVVELGSATLPLPSE